MRIEGKSDGSADKSHANYNEAPSGATASGEQPEIKVDPPLSSEGRRRSRDTRRAASPWRKQLIILMVDDSRSMRRFEKCEYATETAREVIEHCRIKNDKMACFDVAVFAYGDMIFTNVNHLLRPCTEIVSDEIKFEGTSGGTKMRMAFEYTYYLLGLYEQGYYSKHEEPERVPPPLIFFLSDGYNYDGDPQRAAEAIKNLKLSIGIPPILMTVGIEKGEGTDVPNVPLMKSMASKTTSGFPLYYDVKDLDLMVEQIATASSSSACSADEIFEVGKRTNPDWQQLAPTPKKLSPPQPKKLDPPKNRRLPPPQ